MLSACAAIKVSIGPMALAVERKNLQWRQKHFKRLPILEGPRFSDAICQFGSGNAANANFASFVLAEFFEYVRGPIVDDVDARICV